ncbi:hypothetical protein [Leuconostoc citreum]
MVLYSVTPNYKNDNRGEVGNDDNIVRILIDPAESERLQAGLKPGTS